MFIITILKTVFVILLGILAILMILFVLALLAPVQYKITSETGTLNLKITWLYRIIRFTYQRDQKKLKILWFDLLNRKEKRKSEKVNKEDNKEDNKEIKYSENIKKDIQNIKGGVNNDENKTTKQKSENNKKAKKARKEKVEKGHVFIDKAKLIYHYEDKEIIFKKTMCFLTVLIKKLLPKEWNATIIVGTGDPEKTGILLGIACMLRPFLQNKLKVYPHFSEKYFFYRANAQGTIFLVPLIYITLKYVFEKPIWKIIKKIWKG